MYCVLQTATVGEQGIVSDKISRPSERAGVLEVFVHRKLLVKCVVLRSEVNVAASVKVTLV